MLHLLQHSWLTDNLLINRKKITVDSSDYVTPATVSPRLAETMLADNPLIKCRIHGWQRHNYLPPHCGSTVCMATSWPRLNSLGKMLVSVLKKYSVYFYTPLISLARLNYLGKMLVSVLKKYSVQLTFISICTAFNSFRLARLNSQGDNVSLYFVEIKIQLLYSLTLLIMFQSSRTSFQ